MAKFIPPGRLYDHSSGKDVFVHPEASQDYLFNQNLPKELEESDYFIGISWGEKEDKVLDLFGYSGIKENWKTNPGVRNWVIRNGTITKDSEITCGEGLILLGREEEYRLKTGGLQEYLEEPFDEEEINKIIGK